MREVNSPPRPVAPVAAPQPGNKRPAFERPALRRLGVLPRVTTAFGGSFTP